MSTIAVGARVPGWPENTWAIVVATPPSSWSPHDVRVFMGAVARCQPALSHEDLYYELRPTPEGVRLRLSRGTAEVVVYAPLDQPASTRGALGLDAVPVTAVLKLSEEERAAANRYTVSPMGGAV